METFVSRSVPPTSVDAPVRRRARAWSVGGDRVERAGASACCRPARRAGSGRARSPACGTAWRRRRRGGRGVAERVAHDEAVGGRVAQRVAAVRVGVDVDGAGRRGQRARSRTRQHDAIAARGFTQHPLVMPAQSPRSVIPTRRRNVNTGVPIRGLADAAGERFERGVEVRLRDPADARRGRAARRRSGAPSPPASSAVPIAARLERSDPRSRRSPSGPLLHPLSKAAMSSLEARAARSSCGRRAARSTGSARSAAVSRACSGSLVTADGTAATMSKPSTGLPAFARPSATFGTTTSRM